MKYRPDLDLEDNYLVSPSRTSTFRNYSQDLVETVNWRWVSRVLVCLILLVAIMGAQRSDFPGSSSLKTVVTYTLNTDYDIRPWFQQLRVMLEEDSFRPPINGTNPAISTSAPQSLPRFIYPVAAGKVVGRYNPQANSEVVPFLGGGITIETNPGQLVRAAYPGEVVSITGDRRFGYSVQIDHGQGLFSITSGCAEVQVELGESVGGSQVIGQMHQDSQEMHRLYFEVRVQGRSVDPLNLIN